jgi:hypothetical protein
MQLCLGICNPAKLQSVFRHKHLSKWCYQMRVGAGSISHKLISLPGRVERIAGIDAFVYLLLVLDIYRKC